ncbi:hypothetical protein [Clostridium sp.]|uniref:hypothetical protein n=1 Tax=Clostridium sp. TaxID=1506 RepID=UPI003F4132C0
MFNLYYEERVKELIINNEKNKNTKINHYEYIIFNNFKKKVDIINRDFIYKLKIIVPSHQHRVYLINNFNISEKEIDIIYYPLKNNGVRYDSNLSRIYIYKKLYIYDKYFIVSSKMDDKRIIKKIFDLINKDDEYVIIIPLLGVQVRNIDSEVLKEIDLLSLEEKIYFFNIESYSDLIHLINTCQAVINIDDGNELDIVLIEALKLRKKIICEATNINYEMLENYPQYYNKDIKIKDILDKENLPIEEIEYILDKFYESNIVS